MTVQKCVIILGMHRSGTSCLAGALEKAGVYLGEVSTHNSHNLKGNRENTRIMKLHDDVLQYNKGAWDDPPLSALWPVHLEKKRNVIISEYKDTPLWGFKDPRTLLVLDGWLRALTHCTFAATFRHPSSVVQSLQRRQKRITAEKCLLLWKVYNEKLLLYQKTYGFPVISFDLDESKYKKKLRKLLKNMKLSPQGTEFYDHSLRHYTDIPRSYLPEDIIRLYSKLQEISI